MLTEALVVAGSVDGAVYALEASTGKLRWKHQTGEQHLSECTHTLPGDCSTGIEFAPVVKGQLVFVANTRHSTLHAIQRSTGRLLWDFAVEGTIRGRPQLYEDQVVLGTTAGLIYALDATTGKLRWRWESEQKPFAISAMALSQGLLVFACQQDSLCAFDLAQQKLRWQQKYGALFFAPLATATHIFLAYQSAGAALASVDRTTGKPAWVFRDKDSEGARIATPALYGTTLYVSTDGRFLHAVDMHEGKRLWTKLTD